MSYMMKTELFLRQLHHGLPPTGHLGLSSSVQVRANPQAQGADAAIGLVDAAGLERALHTDPPEALLSRPLRWPLSVAVLAFTPPPTACPPEHAIEKKREDLHKPPFSPLSGSSRKYIRPMMLASGRPKTFRDHFAGLVLTQLSTHRRDACPNACGLL